MEHLITFALAGTSKTGNADPPEHHPTDRLLTAVDADTEGRLLLRAAVQSVFEQAGMVPETAHEPIETAAADEMPYGSSKLAGLLQNALATDSRDLLIEFLRQMDGSRVLVPHELLPDMLDITDTDVRERLLPVLGERGRWLSAFQADWQWVQTGVATLTGQDHAALQREWEEGTIRDRCQVLSTIRRSDPAAGRSWLEPTFASEKADHRARLLETLERGLQIGDEPFLETCLDDRSTQVTRAAAELLMQIPGSALSVRMLERADAMLTMTTAGRILKKSKLACEPPEKIDKSWQRDGIASKPPSGRGKRAYWAETVISAVPPSNWNCRFECAPAKLIERIEDDPFDAAVLSAWTRAASRFAAADDASAAWLKPLWDHWSARAGRMKGKGLEEAFTNLQLIIPAMSQADAESSLLQLLDAGKGDGTGALSLLTLLRRPWGVEFAQKYVHMIRSVLKRSSDNRSYQWANTLLTAAKAVPRDVFAAALAPWEVKETEKSSWHSQSITRETDRFTEKIRMRQSFYEEITASDLTHDT